MDAPTLFSALSTGLSLFKDALALAKDTKDLLPDSKNKEAITKGLEEAEKATKIAEAEIAKALGYNLCQCTWPPQIMLSIGYQNYIEKYQCKKCNKIFPPDIPPKGRSILSEGIKI